MVATLEHNQLLVQPRLHVVQHRELLVALLAQQQPRVVVLRRLLQLSHGLTLGRQALRDALLLARHLVEHGLLGRQVHLERLLEGADERAGGAQGVAVVLGGEEGVVVLHPASHLVHGVELHIHLLLQPQVLAVDVRLLHHRGDVGSLRLNALGNDLLLAGHGVNHLMLGRQLHCPVGVLLDQRVGFQQRVAVGAGAEELQLLGHPHIHLVQRAQLLVALLRKVQLLLVRDAVRVHLLQLRGDAGATLRELGVPCVALHAAAGGPRRQSG